jgi:hypothetical protein
VFVFPRYIRRVINTARKGMDDIGGGLRVLAVGSTAMLERISSVYTYIGANNMYPIYSAPSLKKNTIERENGGPACTYKK